MKFWIFVVILSIGLVRTAVSTVTSVSITGNLAVVENGNLILTCSGACTNGSCQYSWSPVSGHFNMLTLPNVNRTMNGTSYTCTARDPGDGTTNSDTKRITVYYGPDSVTITPATLTVTEGETYDKHPINCSAVSCNPRCKITWSGSSVSPAQDADSLRLFPANGLYKRGDAKTYTCTVTSSSTGLAKNASIGLIVRYAPVVNLTLDSAKQQLKCVATGEPNNYTVFYIEHLVGNVRVRNVTLSRNGGGHIGTFSFNDPTFEDTGIYKCIVSNGINLNGSEFQTKELEQTFNDIPQIVSVTGTYNVSKGDPLDILVTVYSLPEVSDVTIGTNDMVFSYTHSSLKKAVDIKFHGTSVSPTGQVISVHLSEVREEFFTEATINLTNRVGQASTSVTIYPQGPPDVPSKLTVMSRTHESVTLRLVTGFYNGAPQTLVIQYRLLGNTSVWVNGTTKFAGDEKNKAFDLVVNGLRPETTYTFRAFAYNEYDASGYSATISQLTDEEPLPVGAIVGGIIGSIAVLVILVFLFIFLRRRGLRKASKGSTHTDLNKDLVLKIPTSPTDASTSLTPVQESVTSDKTPMTPVRGPTTQTDQLLVNEEPYENTRINSREMKQVTQVPESKYSNFNIQKTPDTVVYRKSSDESTKRPVPSYIDLIGQENPEKVEEAYMDMDIVKDKANKKETNSGKHTERQISEKPYENLNDCKDIRDYINVEQFKKKKEKSEEEDTYLNMEIKSSGLGDGSKDGKKFSTSSKISVHSGKEKERPVISPKPCKPASVKPNDEDFSDYDTPLTKVYSTEESEYVNLRMQTSNS